jgi:flagellar basal-body rod protein FlgB
MTIADLPFFGMLKGKLRWHEARQAVLAENVANADTPCFRPRDFATFGTGGSASRSLRLARTEAGHLGEVTLTGSAASARPGNDFETTPRGNAVVLEEEMMRVAGNQMDFQAASTLYERGMRLLRTAVGGTR